MVKKLILAAFIHAALATSVCAQVNAPIYRQFYFNPFLQNAGFVGMNQKTELNIFYKKQWMGMKDAPSTTGISLEIPTGSRVAVGLKIISDNQVVLKNTSAIGTFGYIVPVGKEQSVTFALSGGVGLNRFDFTSDELNTNDPAVLKAAGNNYNINGNFGTVYKNKNLKVGVALTNLFHTDPFNDETHNTISMRTLKNYMVSVSYKFNLDRFENYSLECFAIHNETIDDLNDYWEAAALFHYQDKIWSGTSYNNTQGLAFHFGMGFLEKFKFSYTYELPASQNHLSLGSSHELHLKMTLSK